MASISTLVDRVKIFVNSSGTGPFALGSAVPAFRGTEALADGFTYSYAVESDALYEAGTGVYIASLGQLQRTPIISSSGGASVAFPAGVQVAFTALAQDLIATGGDLALRGQLAATSGADMVGAVDGASGALFTTVQGAVGYLNSVKASLAALAAGTVDIGFTNPLGGPAVLRLLRSRLGETVSATDYVVGDGSADDTEAYQALVNLQPAEITYPKDCEIAVTETVLWIGNQTHRFADNARITGDLDGFAVRGLGYPDDTGLVAAAPIARGALSFAMTTNPAAAGLAIGDDYFLYDTITAEYDINTVAAIVGNTVYPDWPINYAFANAANIRLYKLANACRNVNVFGGQFRNVNASLGAGGLSFLYATDISLNGVSALDTGGIGMEMSLSMRFATNNALVNNTGGVGLGHRVVRSGSITNFRGFNPNHDESLTFYKNCTHISVYNTFIEQYLSGQAPAGNIGQAGNCILVDDRCTDVLFDGLRLRGSATYGLFVTANSNRISVNNFDISMANIGGIRLGVGCTDNRIGRGRVTDIVDATDVEQGGIATAAIQDESGTSGNILGTDVTFARLTSGIEVRARGTAGTARGYGNRAVKGGAIQIETADWNGTSVGTRGSFGPVAATGSTYMRVAGETAGGTDFGTVALSARSGPPALTFDGDVVFSVSPSQITLTWRDFAGATHSASLPAA